MRLRFLHSAACLRFSRCDTTCCLSHACVPRGRFVEEEYVLSVVLIAGYISC